jgi:excisionase family DNA binding protein
MEDLLTAREVKEILKLDRITIYRMIQDGRLHGTKVGQQWRFSRQEVERLAGSKRPSAQSPTSAESGLPVHCIQTIQDLFSDISAIPSLYVNADGQPATQISHPCRFCQAILSSPSGRQACQASWQEYVQNSRRTYVTCHAGLQYVGAPVTNKNEEIGLFIAGQFYLNAPDPIEESERIQRLAAEHQIPLATLQQSSAAIPVIRSEQRGALEAWPFSAARAIQSILRERTGFMNRLQQIAELTKIP